MTGEDLYEELKKMTPEERKQVCYTHPWPLSGLKDLVVDLTEFWELDRKKADKLLKDDKKMMELLEEAVDSDNARESVNDEVDEYLKLKLKSMLEPKKKGNKK